MEVEIAGGEQTTVELIGATVGNGMTASIIILAMSLGLVVPKMVIDYLNDPSTAAKS